MSDSDKSVFISYRRDGGDGWARVIFGNLSERGYKVFLDVDSIDSGNFERIILNQIEAHAHFLVLLTPRSLNRCSEPHDWLAREIEHAIKLQRNIVPLMFPPFSFNKLTLPAAIASLSTYNALHIHNQYFDEGMTKLRDRFLKQPVYGAVKPTPSADHAKVLDLLKASTHEVAARKPTDWFNLFPGLEKIDRTTARDTGVKKPPSKLTDIPGLAPQAFAGLWSDKLTKLTPAEKDKAFPSKAEVTESPFTFLKPGAEANPWMAIANKATTADHLKPGNFQLSAVGIPLAMLQKLEELLANGETIKQVAFSPSGSWVFIRNQCSFWQHGVPQEMGKQLWAQFNEGLGIANVALGPNDCWAILHDERHLMPKSRDIPAGLLKKLLNLYRADKEIKCVAISATGGWVVLFGKNGFWSDNIPVDLYNKLHEWGDLHYDLRQVVFGPNSGWVLLAGATGWWHGNIPNAMAEKLREYHAAGKTINSVAISPDSGWAILGN